MSRGRGGRAFIAPRIPALLAALVALTFGGAPHAQDEEAPALMEAPALSVEGLEFLPGQGREARHYLLYQFPDQGEAYMDLWDIAQILQSLYH